jgi:hypothetical protein
MRPAALWVEHIGDSGEEGIYNKGFIFFSNPYTSHFSTQVVASNSKC